MSPATLALILSLIEEAVKEAPAVVTELQSIFSNPNPTPADWENLRATVLAKTYKDYVPATQLTQ